MWSLHLLLMFAWVVLSGYFGFLPQPKDMERSSEREQMDGVETQLHVLQGITWIKSSCTLSHFLLVSQSLLSLLLKLLSNRTFFIFFFFFLLFFIFRWTYCLNIRVMLSMLTLMSQHTQILVHVVTFKQGGYQWSSHLINFTSTTYACVCTLNFALYQLEYIGYKGIPRVTFWVTMRIFENCCGKISEADVYPVCLHFTG